MQNQKKASPKAVSIPKLDYLSINKTSPSNNQGYANEEKVTKYDYISHQFSFLNLSIYKSRIWK